MHAVHDRYLVEVVEGMNLCPFARQSRELGRVHRPLFWTDAGPVAPGDAARAVLEVHDSAPDAEIILLTFIDARRQFADPREFDAFCVAVRGHYAALHGPEYFMVSFHPCSGDDRPTDRPINKDILVPLLRRSPDPVIQCVRAEVLTQVRAHAQRVAKKRLLERLGGQDPRMRAIVENSIQTDSELSAEIARNNFAAVAEGQGRARLEAVLSSIVSERAQRYGF